MVTSTKDLALVETELATLKSFWSGRQKQVQKWSDLRALKDEFKGAGLESLVSNDPKTFFDLSLFFLSNRPARHRIPIQTQNTLELDKGGKSERALVSIWRDKDRSQTKRGKGSWLREVSDFLLHMGWISVLAALQSDQKGNPIFTAEIWNPLQTFPWWGEDDLDKVFHEYPTTVKSINDKSKKLGWGNTIPGDDDKIIYVVDVWRKREGIVSNEVYARSGIIGTLLPTLWIPPTTSNSPGMIELKAKTDHSELDSIPVIVAPVAGWADRGGLDNDSKWQDKCYEGILETNAQLYKAHNRWLTFLMQGAKDVVHPMVVDESDSGKPVVTKEDVEQKRIVHTKPGEKVGVVHLGGDYNEANIMMANLDGMVQRGSYPWMFFGAVPFEMSGFAISQLLSYALAKVGPYAQVLESTLSIIDHNWLEGYKTQKLNSIKIAGNSKITSHDYFVEDFKHTDVPDMVYVECTIPLSLPTDIVQRVTLARQLMPQGQILDTTTILDRILEEQDPELVRQRITEDELNASPIMRQARLLEALQDRMNYYKTKKMDIQYAIVAQVFQAILSQLGQQPGITSMPPKEGVPPEVLPGEMTNIPGEQVQAVMGQGTATPSNTPASLQQPVPASPSGPQIGA